VLAASIIRAIMEVASTSGTSVNFYKTTWRINPEDSHLHTRRRENQKSQNYYYYYFIIIIIVVVVIVRCGFGGGTCGIQ
jgi:hypothetical protein